MNDGPTQDAAPATRSAPVTASVVEAPPLVGLSEKAAAKIRALAGSNDEYRGKVFRAYIEGGGCSGFQYGFTFEEEREGDTRLTLHGADLLVDPQSAMYLTGSLIDWVETLTEARFVVKNPNAKGSCGCGLSFSV
jgi:iron-sulfur cluster assembly accessory protein